jgi:hypothetical protein
MPPSDAMTRDPWTEINARPSNLRKFGAALDAKTDGRIPAPELITEPTRRITRRGYRSPPCPKCGADGPYFCICEVDQ